MSKLFHTLVVFSAGASLVGCGGKSTGTTTTGGSGAGGSAGVESTGGASAGGTADGGSGGATTSGSGGVSNGGAMGTGGHFANTGGVIQLGGSGGEGGSSFVAPAPAVVAQWNCSQAYVCELGELGSTFVNGFSLIGRCVVEPNRPMSSADCPSGTTFVCHAAFLQGHPLLVNCECQVVPDGGCVSCQTAQGVESVPLSCGGEAAVCECAITGILR